MMPPNVTEDTEAVIVSDDASQFEPRQGFVPNPYTSGATGRIGRRQFLRDGRTDFGCALNPRFRPSRIQQFRGLTGRPRGVH